MDAVVVVLVVEMQVRRRSLGDHRVRGLKVVEMAFWVGGFQEDGFRLSI